MLLWSSLPYVLWKLHRTLTLPRYKAFATKIHCFTFSDQHPTTYYVSDYRKLRGISNTSRHISFEFLLSKLAPLTNYITDLVSSLNSLSGKFTILVSIWGSPYGNEDCRVPVSIWGSPLPYGDSTQMDPHYHTGIPIWERGLPYPHMEMVNSLTAIRVPAGTNTSAPYDSYSRNSTESTVDPQHN